MKDVEKTVENMIDKQRVAFIGSVDANTSSLRVSQFLKESRSCLYFCDTRFFKGIMLKGRVEVLTDHVSKEMIWREGDTMYYKEGVTDPDYCVLKFTAVSGRYYSNFKSENFVMESSTGE